MALSSTQLLVHLLVLAALATHSSAQSNFKCTSIVNCHALIDYVTPNTTTLSSIQNLFSLKNLRSILGANNLNISTSPNQTVQAKQTLKIPFVCTCSNGTGISNGKPIYVVQPGDGLDHIARDVFSALVTYQQIAAANNIPDVNKIEVGQKLQIPLPCSCDEVDGKRVVHYGYVVESGNTLETIAGEYGTTADTLSSLNGVNNTSLQAGQVLDVPLQACNSSVGSNSPDYPFLVSNGTYVFTANGCVKCKCDAAANNWILQCEPSGLRLNNSAWSTCPSMQCAGADNLSIGNSTTAGCNTTTCAYAGYSNQTILTTLATVSTCAANIPGPDNFASRNGLSWEFLLIFLHLIMLCAYPL